MLNLSRTLLILNLIEKAVEKIKKNNSSVYRNIDSDDYCQHSSHKNLENEKPECKNECE